MVDSTGVSRASDDLDEFSKSASRSATSADEFSDSVSSVNLGSLEAAAGVAALAGAAYKLVSSLGEAAQSALQAYSHFEQMENGLATVFQSAEKGKAVFEDLRAFSFKTTFGVDELADAATQLYNVGLAEDEVKQKLAMLGDLAGGQKQKFAELVSIYGKIVSTGQAGAMQMQQLALRGIPISQVLHDMGVEGKASAEQITEAFERLTGEGGRFHDAMSSIIDTIEGKEGFLSDTLKEMSVNFAEASGLAEAYKGGLDAAYGAVQALTDKFAEIGENPTAKAIFQGTLVATIAGVGTALTTALVPALGAVAAKMGIISVLSAAANPAALIGGAVVGLAAFGIAKEIEHSKELTKEVDELVDRRRELQKLQDEGTATFEEQVELQRTQVALAEELLRRREEERSLYGVGDDYSAEAKEALDMERQKLAAMIEQKATMEKWAQIYRVVEANAKRVKAAEEERAKVLKMAVEESKKWYDKTDEGQLANLRQQLEVVKKLTEAGGYKDENAAPVYNWGTHTYDVAVTWLTDEQKKMNAALQKELQKQEKELELKIKLGPERYSLFKTVEDTQKYLKNTEVFVKLGVATDDDLLEAEFKDLQAKIDYNLKDLSMNPENAATLKVLQEQIDRRESLKIRIDAQRALEDAQRAFADAQINVSLGFAGARGDQAEAEANLIRARLRKAYDDSGLTGMDPTSDAYAEQLTKLREINAAEYERLDAIQRQNDAYGYMSQKLTEVFTNAGLSAEAAKMLGDGIVDILKTQVSNTLINGFQAIGNALGEGASAGDAMKQTMLNFVQQTLSQTSALAINAGLAVLSNGGITMLPAALALFALGGVTGIGAGILGSSSKGNDYESRQKEQLELLKALNEQYKSLYDAIKEQEEYYLQKRRQINSTAINEGFGLTQVNDMILTPQGNFSTSPKDYLIATKTPESLFGGGNPVVNVVINNTVSDTVETRQRNFVDDNGRSNIVVDISRKVAQDYATGSNGWDYAIDANAARRRGRSLA